MVAIFGPPPENTNLSKSTAMADTAAVIVLLALAAIAVVFRFVARSIQRSGLKMDDWTIILALVCARIAFETHVWRVLFEGSR